MPSRAILLVGGGALVAMTLVVLVPSAAAELCVTPDPTLFHVCAADRSCAPETVTSARLGSFVTPSVHAEGWEGCGAPEARGLRLQACENGCITVEWYQDHEGSCAVNVSILARDCRATGPPPNPGWGRVGL